MGNLLFSPSGRIGPSDFLKGVVILIVVAILLSAPAFLGLPDAVALIASIISFATIWCWVVLWVKRYHDGGKSGWMCLVPILVYLIVYIIAFVVIAGAPFMEMITAAMEGAGEDEIAALEAEMNSTVMLPLSIAGIVISFGIAFLFNNMIKHEDHDNRFGPMTSTADNFN